MNKGHYKLEITDYRPLERWNELATIGIGSFRMEDKTTGLHPAVGINMLKRGGEGRGKERISSSGSRQAKPEEDANSGVTHSMKGKF